MALHQAKFNRQMVKFSTAAKLTQAKYGTSSQPAIFELRKKATVVAAIASHRITISTKAQPGWCMPKKIQDQETFRTICTATGYPVQ